jgi:FlaA1/EpsC-like NDP-sugar epimerase
VRYRPPESVGRLTEASPFEPATGNGRSRLMLLMLRDALVIVTSCWLALAFRFDGAIPAHYLRMMAFASPLVVAILLGVGLARGLYGGLPMYASLQDLMRLSGVVGITTLIVLVIGEAWNITVGKRPIPLSVCIMQALIMFLGLGALNIAPRVTAARKAGPSGRNAHRVLIVGAGNAGELVAREMLRSGSSDFVPVGFLDDDPRKIGKRIHGLQVFGPICNLAEAVQKTAAQNVVIALPRAPSRVIRQVVSQAGEVGLKAKIVPSLVELMGEPPQPEDIRDVDISDLIARSQVTLDYHRLGELFHARTVLVTGAAGSIGSAVARQALNLNPRKLILLDNNETDLYSLFTRLCDQAKGKGVRVEMEIADIRDRTRVWALFESHRPHIVFHAAAYKHVPVMELHPAEAVKTNVTGTRNVAEAAQRFEAERFVLVSTDKAINPTSVMGATKRLAEMVILNLGRTGTTAFASVRFGNVLASRGSVVPIFQQQIRDGGPITVTHPDATRYFMSIEEAAALIWQAGALAKGGETFVLEMGEPVRIMDLAIRMRSLLANGSSDKIEIVVTGLREGEKLHEDLWNTNEDLHPVQPGILRARSLATDPTAGEYLGADDKALDDTIAELEMLSMQAEKSPTIVQALFALTASLSQQRSPLSELLTQA